MYIVEGSIKEVFSGKWLALCTVHLFQSWDNSSLCNKKCTQIHHMLLRMWQRCKVQDTWTSEHNLTSCGFMWVAIFFLTNSMTSTLDMTSQTPTGKDTTQSGTIHTSTPHPLHTQHNWQKNWQKGRTITGKYNELVVWSEVNCDHLWVSCRKRRHRCIRIACLRSLW